MTAAAYSGMRSLAGVLDQTRVIRSMRTASLAEAAADCVYTSTPGGQVTRHPVTKRTDKRIYFDDGRYISREHLERDGYACPNTLWVNGHSDGLRYVYATPGLAEALAGEGLPHALPDWRDEEDKARDWRKVMRLAYASFHEHVDQMQNDWLSGVGFITGEEAAVIHARIDDAVKAIGFWDEDLTSRWWRDESRERYRQAARRAS